MQCVPIASCKRPTLPTERRGERVGAGRGLGGSAQRSLAIHRVARAKGGGLGKSDGRRLHSEDDMAVRNDNHGKPVFDHDVVGMVVPVCHLKVAEEMGW